MRFKVISNCTDTCVFSFVFLSFNTGNEFVIPLQLNVSKVSDGNQVTVMKSHPIKKLVHFGCFKKMVLLSLPPGNIFMAVKPPFRHWFKILTFLI